MIEKFKKFIVFALSVLLSLSFVSCTLATTVDNADFVWETSHIRDDAYERYQQIYFALYYSNFYESLKDKLECDSDYIYILEEIRSLFGDFFDYPNSPITKISVASLYIYTLLETDAKIKSFPFLSDLKEILEHNDVNIEEILTYYNKNFF